MAELKNKLSIDVNDFIKGLTLAQEGTIKIGEELKALEKTKLSDPYEQLIAQSKIAQRTVVELEKQLKSALISGDPKAIETAKTKLAEAKVNADKLAASIKEVDTAVDGVAESSTQAAQGFSVWNTAVGSALGGGIAGVIQGAASKLIDFGKVAFDEYKKLDTSINNIGTLGVEAAGLSLEEFKRLSTELSTTLPDTAGNIANGIYNAISAGITGTEEEIAGFVEIAGKVAVAGLSDTNTAVNALTSVVNAYGLGVQGAEQVSNTFFAAIKAGKTSFEELNAGLANVVPAASAAGVGFDEVAGTIAKLTTVGIPTSQATTQLRAAIIELQKPGAELAKELAKVGLTAENMAAELAKPREQGGGLVNVLQRLEQSAAASGKSMTQIFSSSEAASAALSLTGKNAESTNQILKNVSADIQDNVAGKAFEAAAKSIDVQFRVFQNNIQAVFNNIFQAVVPVISEVISIFTETLGPAFQDLFDSAGEYFSRFWSIAQPILAAIGGAIIGTIVNAVNVVVATLKIFYDTAVNIFDAVKEAINPLIEAFGSFSNAGGESIDFVQAFKDALTIIGDVIKTVAAIFTGIFAVAIEIATIPLSIIADIAAEVIGWFKGLFGETEQVSKAMQKSVPFMEQVKSALLFIQNASKGVVNVFRLLKDTIAEFIKALASFNIAKALEAFTGFGDKAAAAFNEPFKDAETAAAKAKSGTDSLADSADDAGDKVDDLGNKTDKAGKKTKKAADNIGKLTDELKKLQREQQKQTELETANAIADATERQLAILDIERKYSRIPLEEELAAIKGNSKEALLQREILNARLLALDRDFGNKRNDVLNKLALDQFNNQVELSKRSAETARAINAELIAELQRQAELGNVSATTALVAATRSQVEADLSAAVDAVVESTPQFKKASDEIRRQLSEGLISVPDATKQLDALRQTILSSLLAVPGDSSEFSQKIAKLYDNAAAKITDSERQILSAAEERRIGRISSELLRNIEQRVLELRKEKDLLLQNTELTEEQRAEIEKGFSDAIDNVRSGSLRTFGQAIENIGSAIAGFRFEFDVADQTKATQELQSKTEEVNEALRAGEITYQEAIDRLRELEEQASNTTDVLGQALSQSLAQVADVAKQQVAESLSALQTIQAEIDKLNADTTLTTEQRNKELTELNAKYADQQGEIFGQIGLQAATAFGAALAEGQNVGEALKRIIADTAQSLLAVYTPTIIAAFASIIPGPPGLIAGGLAVASLQALLATALAGFKDGGYTGNVGTNEIAGVVHGREFVVNARATAKYRDMLEAMNSGKPIELTRKDRNAGMYVDITGGLHTMASIMADVRDRLDRIPDNALMKQQIGVDVSLDDRLYERQRYRKQVRGLR